MPIVDDRAGDSTPWFSNRLMEAYKATGRGLIIESGNYSEPHYFTQVSEFEQHPRDQMRYTIAL